MTWNGDLEVFRGGCGVGDDGSPWVSAGGRVLFLLGNSELFFRHVTETFLSHGLHRGAGSLLHRLNGGPAFGYGHKFIGTRLADGAVPRSTRFNRDKDGRTREPKFI